MPSVKKVQFSKNPNGNYEIEFVEKDFDISFNFSEKHLGVWNAKTRQGKNFYFS